MYKPIHSIKPNHYGSNSWDCYSYKLKRDVFFYSELEYELWIKLETNKKVVSFCEQPLRIHGLLDNKIHESIFDMWVLWEGEREEFIEVKYVSDPDKIKDKNSRIYRQISLQRNWCMKNNYDYTILTENGIRTQPLLNNLKIMIPFIKNFETISELSTFKALRYIKNQPKSLKDLSLELNFKNINDVYVTIFYLYHQGIILIDIEDFPINQNSKVWLKYDKEKI